MRMPDGTPRPYLRTDCTRTTPDRWKATDTEHTKPDVFLCNGRATRSGATKCYSQPVDDAPWTGFEGWAPTDKAWCVQARARNDGWSCYRTSDECAGRARMDPFADGPCVAMEGRTALMVKYGDTELDSD
jgi:hypothetical protein